MRCRWCLLFSLSLSAKIISIKTLKHSRFISGIYVRVWVRKRARSRTCSSNVKQSKRSRLFTCCFISFRSADRPFIRFVLIFFRQTTVTGNHLSILLLCYFWLFFITSFVLRYIKIVFFRQDMECLIQHSIQKHSTAQHTHTYTYYMSPARSYHLYSPSLFQFCFCQCIHLHFILFYLFFRFVCFVSFFFGEFFFFIGMFVFSLRYWKFMQKLVFYDCSVVSVWSLWIVIIINDWKCVSLWARFTER